MNYFNQLYYEFYVLHLNDLFSLQLDSFLQQIHNIFCF